MKYENSAILIKSGHKPRLLVQAAKNGDNSFAESIDYPLYELIPEIEDYEQTETGIALYGMINVEPHTDAYVGNGGGRTIAMFGLMSGGKNFNLLVRNGVYWDIIKMKPGDWVLFDDKQEHMVMAESVWSGIAIQLKEI